jgi:hypothetical protein
MILKILYVVIKDVRAIPSYSRSKEASTNSRPMQKFFIGMINYLTNFELNLVDTTPPLTLLKKYVELNTEA